MIEPQTRYRDLVCATHGAFTSWPMRTAAGDTWSGCELCAREQQEAHERINASGLDGRFLETTFSTFIASTPEQRAVLQACRQWVADIVPKVWRPLWLIGPPGTGKTHLLSAVVRASITDRRWPARIASAREIVRELRETWRRGSDRSEQDVLQRFAFPAVVAIDELGVGFGGEAEAVQLLDVVDKRYSMRRQVIIASNLNLPGLQAALGDRIVDRLAENALVLRCTWPSHRRGAGLREGQP